MKKKHKQILVLAIIAIAIIGTALVKKFVFTGPHFDTSIKSLIRTKPHQTALLNIGHLALCERIRLFREAKKSICIQTFIWTNDEVGQLMLYELYQAAKRGVKVRIIADQMFSTTDPAVLAYASSLHPNLEIKHYNPVSTRISPNHLDKLTAAVADFKGLNQRMHNKLLVVDGETAITGGRNIENTYYDNAEGLNFKDRDVWVKGEVVNDMQSSFEMFWAHPLAVRSSDLNDIVQAQHQKLDYPLADIAKGNLANAVNATLSDPNYATSFQRNTHTVKQIAFFSDIPGKNLSDNLDSGGRITSLFVALLSKAKSSVTVQSPYLVLSEKGLELFRKLHSRKLDLTFITNSLAATDNWPTYAMYYKQKQILINDLSVSLHEFKPNPKDRNTLFPRYQVLADRMEANPPSDPEAPKKPYMCLHAKSMVVDDKVACVGSYNCDPRSANLNTEVALIIWDKGVARDLKANIAIDCKPSNSWVVAKRQRPIGVKQIADLMVEIRQTTSSVTKIDMWPIQHTSCFELKPGKKAVAIDSKKFYENFEDVGNFPEVPVTSEKQIYSRLFKAFGSILTPIL